MTVAKPKVCSLFAGIGGIDLAFAQAGFEDELLIANIDNLDTAKILFKKAICDGLEEFFDNQSRLCGLGYQHGRLQGYSRHMDRRT